MAASVDKIYFKGSSSYLRSYAGTTEQAENSHIGNWIDCSGTDINITWYDENGNASTNTTGIIPKEGNTMTGFTFSTTNASVNYIDFSNVTGEYGENKLNDVNIQNVDIIDGGSNITDASGMFQTTLFINAPYLNTENCTDMSNMYNSCFNMESAPDLNTDNCTSIYQMYYYCIALKHAPSFSNTSKCTNVIRLFSWCNNLEDVQWFDTSSATNFNNIFSYCNKLTSIPLYDTHNVTNFQGAFRNTSITTLPNFDFSLAQGNKDENGFENMCNYCTKLVNIGPITAPNLKCAKRAFMNCTSLETPGKFTLATIKNTYSMFQGCTKLKSVELSLGPNLATLTNMFYGCTSLETVTGFRLDGTTSGSDTVVGNMFYGCSSLVNLSFEPDTYIAYKLTMTNSPLLSYNSIKNILTAASLKPNTNARPMTLNNTIADQEGELAALIAACTAIGWTISGLTLT